VHFVQVLFGRHIAHLIKNFKYHDYTGIYCNTQCFCSPIVLETVGIIGTSLLKFQHYVILSFYINDNGIIGINDNVTVHVVHAFCHLLQCI